MTTRKGKRAPPRKEGKTCLSSIRDDSMNREDQNKNVFKNRISSSPRSTIDNYVFVGIKTRTSFSLSLFLSLFLATKRKKRTRYATTNINTRLRRARYRSSFVLRPTFEVEIIKCKQLINQCGVLVWSLSYLLV